MCDMNMKITVLWNVTTQSGKRFIYISKEHAAYIFRGEDGGSRVFRNVGRHYQAICCHISEESDLRILKFLDPRKRE